MLPGKLCIFAITPSLTEQPMALSLHQRRRVVVTGIGAVSPLGVTFAQTWNQLCKGHCGVTSLTKALQHQNYTTPEQLEQDITFMRPVSCQVAAAVPNFVASQTTNRNTSRVVKFALSAADEAIQSARLTDWWGNTEERGSVITNDGTNIGDSQFSLINRRQQRTGVSIGTGMSGVRDLVHSVRTLDEGVGGNVRKISPYLVPLILGNSASSRVAIQYGLRGPNVSATTACAAGSHAIGDAVRYIQSNMADIMLAGGGEACIDPLSFIGFHRLRALSTQYNDTPEKASRPFDANRDGFVMGEGACILVLEEMEHAIRRFHGIPPSLAINTEPQGMKSDDNDPIERHSQSYWIEVCGYGASGDAHHITSPDPTGRGAIEAMQQSVQEAAASSENSDIHVDYVNAHATSTPVGDEIEAMAIRKAFSIKNSTDIDGPRRTYVSSTKGATGHLLGAAGAIEAAFTIQSLVEQKVIPTLNLDNLLQSDKLSASRIQSNDTEFVFVQGKEALSLPSDLNVAVSNSFGFGGANASLTFRRTTK
jgi:3-oxoacyl-[acyl-carrier-protein] synthase II